MATLGAELAPSPPASPPPPSTRRPVRDTQHVSLADGPECETDLPLRHHSSFPPILHDVRDPDFGGFILHPQRPAAPTPPSSGSQSDRQTAPPLQILVVHGVQHTPRLIFPADHSCCCSAAPQDPHVCTAPLLDSVPSMTSFTTPSFSFSPPFSIKNCRQPSAVRAPTSSRTRPSPAPLLPVGEPCTRNFTHPVDQTWSSAPAASSHA